ncbi:MAG: amidohydrolase family protein [Phycisphaera sp.]|nr:amidohydrolase family protein [Phycisphaera sp.]
MIVDTHTFYWQQPEQVGPAVAQRLVRQSPDPWDRPGSTPEAFDEATSVVDIAIVLALQSPLTGASISFEDVATFVKRRPDRLLGMGCIDPLRDRNAALDDLVAQGLVGVVVSPAMGGYSPTHSRAMRLFERCEEKNLPVMVVSNTALSPTAQLEFAQPFLWDEVARAFPTLRVCLSGMAHPFTDQALALVDKHPHVYADTAEVAGHPWRLYNNLLAAYEAKVIDKLLFASGYPFCQPRDAVSAIYTLHNLCHGTPLPVVPREALRAMVERDALACLGIPAPKNVLPTRAERRPESLNDPVPDPLPEPVAKEED